MKILPATLILATFGLAAAATADAATVAAPNIACRAEADSKKILEFDAKKDDGGREKFAAAKIASGDCTRLFRGMPVSVDKQDGPLLCVRETGGLDCYWAVADAINRKPPPEAAGRPKPPDGDEKKSGPGGAGGVGRGGGFGLGGGSGGGFGGGSGGGFGGPSSSGQ